MVTNRSEKMKTPIEISSVFANLMEIGVSCRRPEPGIANPTAQTELVFTQLTPM
jgi:hypothetical protein